MVIDEQHAHACQRAWHRRRLFFHRARQIQRNPEGAALAQFAVDADLPAHQLDEQLADGQAEAGAAILARGRRIGLGEFFKDFRPLVGGQADAGVGHRQAQMTQIAFFADLHVDHDVPARGELDRIRKQVGDDLPHARGIALHAARGRRRIMHHQLQALVARIDALHLRHGFDFMQQVERDRFELQLARFDLGEIEDVIDQLQQAFGTALRHGGEFALGIGELGVKQQVEHADYAIHRRPDFVAHIGQEHRFDARRIFRLLLGDAQAFGLLARFGFVHPETVPDERGVGQPGRHGTGIDPAPPPTEFHARADAREFARIDRMCHQFLCRHTVFGRRMAPARQPVLHDFLCSDA